MKIDVSGITSIFEEKELEEFKSLAKQSDKLLDYISRVVEHRAGKLYKPSTLDDFENTAWPLQKAYKEGRLYELLWMLEFFTKE